MNALVSVRRLEPSILANHIITEDSAATEFVERYGEDLRFCHRTGAWYLFRGTHWEEDETGKVFQMARLLARQLSENQEATKLAGLNRTSFTSGIHVVHLLIDAGVDSEAIHQRMKAARGISAADIPPDSLTKTSSIAEAYWFAHAQSRDGWTHELDLRPSVETW